MESDSIFYVRRSSGVSYAPVNVATTVAGVLATDFENGDIVDGQALLTGQRILIKNQVSAIENGVYFINNLGAPTRDADLPTGSSAFESTFFVYTGTVNANLTFICSTNPPCIVDTDALNWVLYTSPTSGSALLNDEIISQRIVLRQYSLTWSSTTASTLAGSCLLLNLGILGNQVINSNGTGYPGIPLLNKAGSSCTQKTIEIPLDTVKTLNRNFDYQLIKPDGTIPTNLVSFELIFSYSRQ